MWLSVVIQPKLSAPPVIVSGTILPLIVIPELFQCRNLKLHLKLCKYETNGRVYILVTIQ